MTFTDADASCLGQYAFVSGRSSMADFCVYNFGSTPDAQAKGGRYLGNRAVSQELIELGGRIREQRQGFGMSQEAPHRFFGALRLF